MGRNRSYRPGPSQCQDGSSQPTGSTYYCISSNLQGIVWVTAVTAGTGRKQTYYVLQYSSGITTDTNRYPL
ncbi:hypothetical protein L484_008836 [Morus notabilis]|uniref:Uncharacterized protein n=1 Tax=Morus notabilis TaxID=981085 RepID=W9R2Y7_9ROSA|nr:hypothetical protein L484_008836 [Morus notabilis]